MAKSTRTLTCLALAAALAACGERTGPFEPPAAIMAGVGPASIADLSGSWNWSRVELLTMPPFVAQLLFGIAPEGPVTKMTCEGSGELTLNQMGSTFSGVQTLLSATCETKGGIVFVPPPQASPILSDIVEGEIKGRSIHFVSVADILGCPHNGVISGVNGGTATGLKATGRCIVPGHPHSPVPMDPPPAGTSKTVSWEAVRQ